MNDQPLEHKIYPPRLINGNRQFRRQKLKVRRKDGTTLTKPSMQKRLGDRKKREASA